MLHLSYLHISSMSNVRRGSDEESSHRRTWSNLLTGYVCSVLAHRHIDMAEREQREKEKRSEALLACALLTNTRVLVAGCDGGTLVKAKVARRG